jgi:hypothetical protein
VDRARVFDPSRLLLDSIRVWLIAAAAMGRGGQWTAQQNETFSSSMSMKISLKTLTLLLCERVMLHQRMETATRAECRRAVYLRRWACRYRKEDGGVKARFHSSELMTRVSPLIFTCPRLNTADTIRMAPRVPIIQRFLMWTRYDQAPTK